jgi:Flp pilus assembly protein TadD
MKHRGHRDVAARHFRDADKINPQDVTALINLAIIDGENGDLTASEAKLREAIRRRPEKAEACANLATALHLQGKDREAELMREQAKRLAPDG